MVKRLTTTNHFVKNEEMEYEIPNMPTTEKIIDDSNFVPESEIIKQLNGKRDLTASEVEIYYDFPNGRDTGEKVPFQRTTANVDLSILSSHIREVQGEIKGEVNEKIAEAARKAEREASISKIIQGSQNTSE